ncbi:hypothetical protein ACP70R_029969 [Stipagrostis hirtigluma subsp. patula]
MEQSPAALPDQERDWSHLPADLLVRVFLALEVPELAASAAVCHGWHAAHRSDPRLDLSGLFRGPCLVYSSGDCGPGVATLRSLSDGALRRVTLPAAPPFRARGVVGSSGGWLVTVGEWAQLLLVNPATRAQFALPPTRTLKRVARRLTRMKELLPSCPAVFGRDPLTGRYGPLPPPEPIDPEDARLVLYGKVAMSSDDPSTGSCVVVFVHWPMCEASCRNQLRFVRVGGDTGWRRVIKPHECDGNDYHDLFYDDDDRLFYALRCTGQVDAIDFHGPSSPVVKVIFKKAANYKFSKKYIVRAPWGDLLQVWIRKTYKMMVFKVDLAEQMVVEVKDLRGHALFIGLNRSFFVPVGE